jgi:hypothetical protein
MAAAMGSKGRPDMTTQKPQQGGQHPAPTQQQGSQTGGTRQQGSQTPQPPRFTDWASI